MVKGDETGRRWLVVVACWLAAAGSLGVARADAPVDEARLKGIAKRVSRLRGLPLKSPVKRTVAARKAMAAHLEQRMDAAYAADYLTRAETMLRRFGLISGSASYKRMVLDLVLANTAGFYDPWEHRLYLAEDVLLGDMLLAHEVTHALQDQFFGLAGFLAPRKHEHDQTLARQALVEGDATATMIEAAARASGKGPAWGDRGVVRALSREIDRGVRAPASPDFMRRNLSFLYGGGLSFVAEIRSTRPWRAVDGVYKRPPLSSEHILHPESYRNYDRPDEIVAGAIPALAGTVLTFHDCLGEIGISSWLHAHGVSESRARLAAAGWGGDRFAVLVRGRSGPGVGVMFTSWDSENDAREFAEAADDALAALAGGKARTVGTLRLHRHADGTVSALVRKDDRVVAVVGAPEPEIAAAIESVFSTWAVRRN